MFTKFATIFTLAVAVMAQDTYTSKCNTGSVQCCNSLKQVSNYDAGSSSNILGGALKQLTSQMGFGCNPITGIGKGGASSCTAAPACCENVHQQSLIGINCSPIIINA